MTFTTFFLLIDLFWWEKSYNYEVILISFQILLRNSLDPDPDSRSSRSGLRFLAGYGFNWTWIRNTGFYKLFYKQFCTYCMYGSLIEYNWSNNNMPGYYNLCVRPFIFFCSYKSCSCFVHISILVLFSMICLFFLFTYWPKPKAEWDAYK